MKPTKYPCILTFAEAEQTGLVYLEEKMIFGAIHKLLLDNLGNELLYEEIKAGKAPFLDVKLIVVWDMLYGSSINGIIL